MNGERMQISEIVIAARKALYDGGDIAFAPADHVRSVRFVFVPKLFSTMGDVRHSVDAWFRFCKKRGLQDIKMIIPDETNRMHLLGFANTTLTAIMCFWEKGKVSVFCPTWHYDKANSGWKVVYYESCRKGRMKNMPAYSDQKEEFQQILSEISDFADLIEHRGFANMFANARAVLCGDENVACNGILAQLPGEMRGIYHAACKADVFGAMGSWNDSPPCYAHKIGLDKEYDELSARLLNQIRYNLLYAVNECWKQD